MPSKYRWSWLVLLVVPNFSNDDILKDNPMTTSKIPAIFPAADRNKAPILEVLKALIESNFPRGQKLLFLEIGSGSGQHVGHFAPELPQVTFQPTDKDSNLFESIRYYREKNGNILEPKLLDVTWDQWPIPDRSQDIVYSSNMVHIAPWSCSVGLFDGAGRVLKRPTGVLVLYGPFSVQGRLEPQSNVDFDRSLRQRDSQWGIRDTDQLTELATRNGLHLCKMIDMPANNKVLFFQFGQQ